MNTPKPVRSPKSGYVRRFTYFLGLLASVGALTSTGWAQTATPVPTDRVDWINHVPESACMALVAFPEAMLQEATMELAPRELITLMGKRELGVDFCQLNQVVLVLDTFTEPSDMPVDFAVIFRFSQPQALSEKNLENLERTEWNGRPAFMIPAPNPVYLVSLDDKTVGLGTDYLSRVLDKQQTAGPLSQLIKSEGLKGQIGYYFNYAAIRPLVKEILPPRDEVPAMFRQFLALPDLIEAVSCDFSMASEGQNSIRFHTKSERDSQRIWELLQTGIALTRETILMQVLSEMGEQDEEMQTAIKSYVDRIGVWFEKNMKPEIGKDRVTFQFEGPNQLQAVSTIGVLVGMLLPAVQQVREAARRTSSSNNMRQILIAMHNYHDTYGRLPDRAIRSPDGKPLLSWRVAILPFLEELDLYEQFRLNEPWDSEHNLALLEQMPAIYQCPNLPASSNTVYQVPYGNGAIYDPITGRKFREITDGLTNTILLLETNAEIAVPWTKPDDYAFDPEAPMAGLGGLRPTGTTAGLADASIQVLPRSIDWGIVRSLLHASDDK